MAKYILKIIVLSVVTIFVIFVYITSPERKKTTVLIPPKGARTIATTYPTITMVPENIDALKICITRRTKEFESAQDYAPGNLIVRFIDSITPDAGLDIIRSYNLEIIYEYRSALSGAAVHVKPGSEPEWACRLELTPGIYSVSFDRISQLQNLENE